MQVADNEQVKIIKLLTDDILGSEGGRGIAPDTKPYRALFDALEIPLESVVKHTSKNDSHWLVTACNRFFYLEVDSGAFSTLESVKQLLARIHAKGYEDENITFVIRFLKHNTCLVECRFELRASPCEGENDAV